MEETVITFLKEGISIDDISEIMGPPKSEVEKLNQKL